MFKVKSEQDVHPERPLGQVISTLKVPGQDICLNWVSHFLPERGYHNR